MSFLKWENTRGIPFKLKSKTRMNPSTTSITEYIRSPSQCSKVKNIKSVSI